MDRLIGTLWLIASLFHSMLNEQGAPMWLTLIMLCAGTYYFINGVRSGE